MNKLWDQAMIQKYINDGIQENLTLDYKAADALRKIDNKKTEITKDVSAMANSVGGIIIYGVREYNEPDKKHLLKEIDPIDQTSLSKEWLEQVINNIRPRIDNLAIYPVSIDSGANQVVYVVEIPQSTTAHQATDHRYYKRFNFLSEPMEDYEVRDVMGRSQHPKIELDFEIEVTAGHDDDNIVEDIYTLNIKAKNTGRVYAQYVNSFIQLPIYLVPQHELENRKIIEDEENGNKYREFYKDNTVRDVVDVVGADISMDSLTISSRPKYGPSRFDPILPGLSHPWSIQLNNSFSKAGLLRWSTYADNAPPNKGEIQVQKIKKFDRRNT
ncbi:ATP-binding protein [bacterium]|nr:ATP-binding protein [bacterium]